MIDKYIHKINELIKENKKKKDIEEDEGGAPVVSGDIATANHGLASKTGSPKSVKRKKPPKDIVGLTEDTLVQTTETDGHTHEIKIAGKDIEKDENSIWKTSPGKKNGHQHTIAMTSKESKEFLNGKTINVETSLDDGHKHKATLKAGIMPIEETYLGDNKVDILHEGKDWKLFRDTDSDKMVFEMTNEDDWVTFQRGHRQNKPQYWQTRPATLAMKEHMMNNVKRNFVVRFGDLESRPMLQNGL